MGLFDKDQEETQNTSSESQGETSEENSDDGIGGSQAGAEETTVKKTVDIQKAEIPGIVDAPQGGLSLDDMARQTKEILSKEPKIGIIIPLDQGEKPGAVRTATINGYRFTVKKNTYVLLPQSVAELFMQSMQTEASALLENPLNLSMADAEKRSALGI